MMDIDFEAQQAAQAQLEPGERLLWFGKPDPRRDLLGTLPLLVFGIPWTAFALFWTFVASGLASGFDSLGWHSLLGLWGIPFVLIGFGMLSTPYLSYRNARQTVYAVTDRRAMIICGARSRKVQSYAAPDIGMIQRYEKPNGKGDVLFATMINPGKNSGTQRVGFTGIANPRLVERLLLDNFKREPLEKPEEDMASAAFRSFNR